jgi:hypothetical protein
MGRLFHGVGRWRNPIRSSLCNIPRQPIIGKSDRLRIKDSNRFVATFPAK